MMSPSSDRAPMPAPALVFGDDGSLEADRAWLWITQQRWPGWDLRVVSCRPPPIGPPLGIDRARPRVWRPPAPREPAAETGFEAVQHLLAEDDPRNVLTDCGDEALVVLGRKGRGGWKALHLGSTAEYVAQHLESPVVIAKTATAVRSVLVCTDGSDSAQRAVDALAVMPWLGQVETVRVIGLYLIGVYDDSDEIAGAVDATVERLEAAPGLGCTPTKVVRDEQPAAAILGDAATMGADLIVLGTRGMTRLRMGLLWGSTARAVIKETESSVLIARAT